MSKNRKKKNKKKKQNFSAQPIQATSQINKVIDQITQDVTDENPPIKNEPIVDQTVILAHQTVKKDLIRILIISLVMLIILAGGVVIRSQTSWINRSADWIYTWMRLGE